jgi:dihydrofolate synthase / folylpolyglutamate synthase
MTESSLEQWLRHLESLHPREMELGLERVSSVAQSLDLLDSPVPVVTVAGTNGKGSTIAVLEALLSEAGQRVGCFTSPHFLRFNERIRVAGEEAADEEIVTAFEQIESARGTTSLTYFEFSTLAALLVFRAREVDVVLLEVGLGGRLDASNIIDPNVAVITGIALDHQDWLGDTRGQIAREKAGIMRPGVPVVIADPDPPPELEACADALGGCDVYKLGEDFGAQEQDSGWQGWITTTGTGRSQLPWLPAGALLADNICAAVQAAALLGQSPSEDVLKKGLARVKLTGRRQLQQIGPRRYLLDVAHNPASVDKLLEYKEISDCNGKVIALFSAMRDKAVGEIVELAAGHFDGWFLADQPANERALPANEVADMLRQQGEGMISISRNIAQAYRRAQTVMAEGDLLVIFGSFFTVAAVLPLLAKDRRRDTQE